jgi:hypothetical protein
MDVNDEDVLVPVSPRHSVRVGPEYAVWIARAPRQDFVVRTILKREANGMPLMSADIVIAGDETRDRYPLAASYPLHFRKTYYPGRLHGDPRQELERQNEAAAILNLPPGIGATHNTFRSCFLPGTPYHRFSPFGATPDEANLPHARQLDLAKAAGLWQWVQSAYQALSRIHQAGLAHGDAELHNFVVCPTPLEILMIDFEVAVKKDEVGEAAFEQRCQADLVPVLREAVFLQCCLGKQPGALAELAWERLDSLFKHPEPFRQEIGQLLPLA